MEFFQAGKRFLYTVPVFERLTGMVYRKGHGTFVDAVYGGIGQCVMQIDRIGRELVYKKLHCKFFKSGIFVKITVEKESQ